MFCENNFSLKIIKLNKLQKWFHLQPVLMERVNKNHSHKKRVFGCCSWDESPYHRKGGCISWTIYSWDTFPPLFQFDKFNRILIIRKPKNWFSNVYLLNISNLQPWTMGNKRKYKEIVSDGPNESPKRGEKPQKMRKSKNSGRTVA